MDAIVKNIKQKCRISLTNSLVFLKWFALAISIGIICGLAGKAFHSSIELATLTRLQNSAIIYLLPLGGLIIVSLYKLAQLPITIGTNQVFEAVHSQKSIPFWMAPLIFIASFITHLLGGSAGREGAALQLGGSLAYKMGQIFRLEKKDLPIIVMCGMSGLFSALFLTPLASAIFAIEVITVGVIYYSAFVPCIITSFTAYGIVLLLGGEKTLYTLLSIPSFTYVNVAKVSALAVLCALLSILFCMVMHQVQHIFTHAFKNEFIRIFVGGVIVIVLTKLIGSSDYNGTGTTIIALAIAGSALPWAFILKIIMTAITIGSGYKGGEIVPLFFIGATFGCVVGPLLGLDPSFSAAIGLIALFCGAVNAPIASIVLGIELFGMGGLAYFAIACAISYMLSGYFSLYSSQQAKATKFKIGFPELKEEELNKKPAYSHK